MKKLSLVIGIISSLLVMNSCCNNEVSKETTQNPIACVSNPDNVKMLRSLKDLDGTGRIYEMDYTADYKLDEALDAQFCSVQELCGFLNEKIFDTPMGESKIDMPSYGCSAYAATELVSGDYLMGRNYDYCHVEGGQEVQATAIVVKTHPENGKKVINMVDAYWLGYKFGFYNDGKSDLSMLMAAPYILTDGMNEDGLAVCMLHLGGNYAKQTEPDKRNLWITTAMRLVLDKCSDVPSAVEMLRQYNVRMDTPADGSCHYFFADAKGHYSIIEYIFEPDADIETANPCVMDVRPEIDDNRYVTNFYLTETLADNDVFGGKAMRGKLRYNILQNKLQLNEYKLTYEEAMQLLGCAATNSNPKENTSHTQWSALYNLSKRTLDLAILKDYSKRYFYDLDK